jgi:hypothetical protein
MVFWLLDIATGVGLSFASTARGQSLEVAARAKYEQSWRLVLSSESQLLVSGPRNICRFTAFCRALLPVQRFRSSNHIGILTQPHP